MARQERAGFESLIAQGDDGRYHKGGWNHYGPGYFLLDPENGVLESHGGMGLFWYSAQEYSDFVLELEFKTSKLESNTGVFLRVPGVPSSDDYIYHSFEVQIYDGPTEEIERDGAVYDAPTEEIHRTGAAFDAEPPSHLASAPTGQWNQFRIAFIGDQLTVELNGEQVLDWQAEPRGKVKDFVARGYIGLQNHDADTSVWFRNIRVRDLSDDV